MGETHTSATTLTYFVVLLAMRLQYECLCKIQVERLSGAAETCGTLLKLHLFTICLHNHYYLHQVQYLFQDLCHSYSFMCFTLAYRFLREVCALCLKAMWFLFMFFSLKTKAYIY